MATGSGSPIHEVRVHPALQEVFSALEAAGVPWCLLRGVDELADPVGDVDMLMEPGDFAQLGRVTDNLGWTPLPAWGHGPHHFFVRYLAEEDRWIKLDCVTEIAFGANWEAVADVVTECLSRRVSHSGIVSQGGRVTESSYVTLNEDDAFWALLLHRVLDKGSLENSHRAQLASLAEKAGSGGPLARHVDQLTGTRSSTDLLNLVKAQEWAELVGAAPGLAAAWQNKLGEEHGVRIKNTVRERQRGRLARVWFRKGISVAILAPDGAGKSTLVDNLTSSFYFPVTSFYMAPYPTGRSKSGVFGLPGMDSVRGLGILWKQRLQAYYQVARGKVVLFDRYSFDSRLPTAKKPSQLSALRRWVVGHSLPAPGLTIVLDAPAEVLFARKGEKTVEILEAERQAYKKLAEGLENGLLVDATQDADTVHREVTEAIWTALSGRWNR